jgi:inhibitor of cysteine peptidase
MMKTSYLIPIVLVLLVACQPLVPTQPNQPQQPVPPAPGNTEKPAAPAGADLSSPIKFNSSDEIVEYLKKSSQSSGSYNYGGVAMRESAMDSAGISKVATPSAAPSAIAGDGGSAVYSTTNVQVAGVDEADFVKNDGKYIYMLNQENLVIVDAYPADKADIVFEDELKGRPLNLFVNGDRLVVFVADDAEVYRVMPYDFMPSPRYVQETKVIIYDIKDRKDPKVVKEYSVTGNYFQARMVGDYVYFIVNDYAYYYDYYVDLPVIKEGTTIVARPDVFHFDNIEDNYVFHTVASFNVNDDREKLNAKSFLMGYANTMYMSEDNIFIAYQKTMPWRYYGTDRSERFFQVVVPMLPSDVQSKIKDIQATKASESAQMVRISEVMQDMYDAMTTSEKEKLTSKIYDAAQEYDRKKAVEQSRSVIHKIAVDDGDIEYVATGEVPGTLLNQFSLDENAGNLRVATTVQVWLQRGSESYNNVYVLDKGMKTIGKLENLAKDESIYSTRFVGDRLYMVTFKRMDPLFVIDLSSPTSPKVLGQLKIPGFSDYLHPYDATHIIGIGKETEENSWGGVSVGGVKLALFDVSDVSNPKQLDSYTIGGPGSDSEALQDHKAFLFDKEKNLLVIPVRDVKEQNKYEPMYGYYRDSVWQGAYVFGVTPKDGFDLKGKITHMEGFEQAYYYGYGGNAVRRALYMGDVLYTVSGKKILMNDLKNIDNEIGEVDLPYSSQNQWYWYY